MKANLIYADVRCYFLKLTDEWFSCKEEEILEECTWDSDDAIEIQQGETVENRRNEVINFLFKLSSKDRVLRRNGIRFIFSILRAN